MPRFLVSKASVRFVALAWCIWGPFLQQPTLQDLLEVADVLNKAVTAVPSEALQESQYLKDMHQGLQLTESQLLKVAGKVHFRNIIYVSKTGFRQARAGAGKPSRRKIRSKQT